MSKLTLSKLNRFIICSSGGILILAILALLFPVAPISSSAIETTDSPTTDSAKIGTTIYAKSVIALATNSQIQVDITPKSTGTFNYTATDIQISTNNRTGYSLFLSSANSDNALHNRDPRIEDVISPMPHAAAPDSDTFANNTWGYNLDTDAEYHAIPSNSTSILQTESANTGESHTLRIGTKIDANLPAGNYEGKIVLSAVVNPITLVTLNDVQYMQHVNRYVCDDSAISTTATLKDLRDDKSYTVAKMRDGNCWMTSNLQLDLSTDIPLTSENSDVADWTPRENTRTGEKPGSTVNGNATSWKVDTKTPELGTQWYYTYEAATADTGKALASGTASGSICPKGWTLPLSDPDNKTANGGFYNLFLAYGLSSEKGTSKAGEYHIVQPDGSTITYSVTDNEFNITGMPLNFSLGGVINLDGTLYKASEGGYYYSANPYDALMSYFMGFEKDAGPLTSHKYYRNVGRSIRCVTRNN